METMATFQGHWGIAGWVCSGVVPSTVAAAAVVVIPMATVIAVIVLIATVQRAQRRRVEVVAADGANVRP